MKCRIFCHYWSSCKMSRSPIMCVFPLYFLAKLVKESGTIVVQVGEGADENFLGH
ncbi:MAG: asparagine synthase-related protein [Nitrospira sp.]